MFSFWLFSSTQRLREGGGRSCQDKTYDENIHQEWNLAFFNSAMIIFNCFQSIEVLRYSVGTLTSLPWKDLQERGGLCAERAYVQQV